MRPDPPYRRRLSLLVLVLSTLLFLSVPSWAEEGADALSYSPKGARTQLSCPILSGLYGVAAVHSHLPAIVEDVVNSPSDEAVRLILGDALSEANAPERHEFYEVQRSITKLLNGRDPRVLSDADQARLAVLRARAEALLEAHGRGWVSRQPGVHYSFQQGILTGAYLFGNQFFDRVEADHVARVGRLYRRNPYLTRLSLNLLTEAQVEALLAHPSAKRLRELIFESDGLSAATVRAVAAAEQLESLSIQGTSRDFRILAEAPKLRLKAFSWTGPVDEETGRQIARSPVFAGVTELSLGFSNEIDGGLVLRAMLPSGKKYPLLTNLDFHTAQFRDADMARFTPTRFPNLQGLVLSNSLVSGPSVLALVRRLPNLRYLDLEGTNVSDEAKAEIEGILSSRRNGN